MKNHLLTEKKIGTADVVVDILPKGKCIPNVKIDLIKITVHDTGNMDASAQANHNYMKNINKSGTRIASWHFTVGYDKIIQAIPCNMKGYHAGCTNGNNTSIGIEIAIYNDIQKTHDAYINAIELIKILQAEYDIPTSKVVQHYNWTGKDCPNGLRHGRLGYRWDWFISKLKANNDNFIVRIIYKGKEGLNVREKPDASSKIKGVVYYGQAFTIVEVKGSWGKLKSGLGWININSKYVQEVK